MATAFAVWTSDEYGLTNAHKFSEIFSICISSESAGILHTPYEIPDSAIVLICETSVIVYASFPCANKSAHESSVVSVRTIPNSSLNFTNSVSDFLSKSLSALSFVLSSPLSPPIVTEPHTSP